MDKGIFVKYQQKTVFLMNCQVYNYKDLETVLEAIMKMSGTVNIYLTRTATGWKVEGSVNGKAPWINFTSPDISKVCHDLNNITMRYIADEYLK